GSAADLRRTAADCCRNPVYLPATYRSSSATRCCSFCTRCRAAGRPAARRDGADLHAERYAAAVTLNEMLTGAPPVWGDGLSDPAATEDEAQIGSERFEPSLRDGLVERKREKLFGALLNLLEAE